MRKECSMFCRFSQEQNILSNVPHTLFNRFDIARCCITWREILSCLMTNLGFPNISLHRTNNINICATYTGSSGGDLCTCKTFVVNYWSVMQFIRRCTAVYQMFYTFLLNTSSSSPKYYNTGVPTIFIFYLILLFICCWIFVWYNIYVVLIMPYKL